MKNLVLNFFFIVNFKTNLQCSTDYVYTRQLKWELRFELLFSLESTESVVFLGEWHWITDYLEIDEVLIQKFTAGSIFLIYLD